jgi:hypothetical protein
VALSGWVRDWDAALAGRAVSTPDGLAGRLAACGGDGQGRVVRVLVELGRGEKYWSAAEDVTALSPPALPRRTAWGDARNRVRTGR